MENTAEQDSPKPGEDDAAEAEGSKDLASVSDVSDPFAYLETGFSSEKFKVEIRNLPKYYGLKELRKLLNNKLKLGCNKIKIPSRGSFWVYVCFRSEQDQEKAIQTLNGYKWKGNVLTADKALAIPDPLIKRRMLEKSVDESGNKRLKIIEHVGSVKDSLKDIVTPLWNLTYEEQLAHKEITIYNVLKALGAELIKVNPKVAEVIKSRQEKFNGLPCEVWPIRHVGLPKDGYRNKCEFTIGINEEDGLKTVGFRLGSYSLGSVSVAPIQEALNVPKRMKEAVAVFELFVRSSHLDVFHPVTQQGYWRQLTVRYSFTTGELMVIAVIHPQKLTKEEIDKVAEDVKQFFTEGIGKICRVDSVFLQLMERKLSPEEEPVYFHLYGKSYIHEKILDRDFRISPQAFFQINTIATEPLYKAIREISNINEDTTVLDVCCGVGSIGICLSDACGEVLGLELSPSAIADAKVNAEGNDVTNAQFFHGKAEDILAAVAFKATKKEVLAILDPPRAGVQQAALTQLRKAEPVNKIVYVSCDPKLALKNFIALGRAPSKTYHREPFLPVRAVAVDLFPYTKHCELVLYFERFKLDEKEE